MLVALGLGIQAESSRLLALEGILPGLAGERSGGGVIRTLMEAW
jgi:hypothetical protein